MTKMKDLISYKNSIDSWHNSVVLWHQRTLIQNYHYVNVTTIRKEENKDFQKQFRLAAINTRNQRGFVMMKTWVCEILRKTNYYFYKLFWSFKNFPRKSGQTAVSEENTGTAANTEKVKLKCSNAQ